jgi:hypothetical protein
MKRFERYIKVTTTKLCITAQSYVGKLGSSEEKDCSTNSQSRDKISAATTLPDFRGSGDEVLTLVRLVFYKYLLLYGRYDFISLVHSHSSRNRSTSLHEPKLGRGAERNFLIGTTARLHLP